MGLASVGVSPQSRGRKRKRQQQAPERQRSPFADCLKAITPVVARGEVREFEDMVSDLLGLLYDPSQWSPDRDPVLAMIAYVGRKKTVPALALLRAVVVLGWTDEQRAAAAQAVDAIGGRARFEPAWMQQLGAVSSVEAWALTDVFGDQATLLCVFERSGDRHGLLVLVDFNHLGGWTTDITLTDDPAGALQDLRRASGSDDATVLERVPLERARRLVEQGIAVTDRTMDPEISEDFTSYRALALARCRAMPGPESMPVPPEHSEEERAALVDRFLADCAGRLPDPDAARYCARLLIDYGCDYDAGRPLRVSPAKTNAFMLGFVPRKVILDRADREALPTVVRAFTGWAPAHTPLPPQAAVVLDEAVAEIIANFDDAYDDRVNASPVRALLSDLAPAPGVADVQETVARRMFAMPYFGTRIGAEDFPRLDPSDEDERHLLVVGEHPEFHAALADPDFDAEIEGVNPRLHIGIDEAVIAQLWGDDPPQVWAAAQRLQAAGMDRLEIIHQLGGVFVEHLHGALAGELGFDAAAYGAALDATAAPGATQTAVLQLKVTLRGSKPPIWRRLRVPASTTLAAFHQVLQAAFGWQDEHLHVFGVGERRYAPGWFELADTDASERVRLSSVCGVPGAKLVYEYDMGDSWLHDVVVEDIDEADRARHAVCVGGRRAGPVEDCGGIYGWQELCETLADPNHPEHADRLDWLGFRPDPAAFDQTAVNNAMAGIRLG